MQKFKFYYFILRCLEQVKNAVEGVRVGAGVVWRVEYATMLCGTLLQQHTLARCGVVGIFIVLFFVFYMRCS